MIVGFLLKRAKPEAAEIAAELAAWLKTRGHDSLIVGKTDAPPPGSTAYTLAAGGPIVHPEVRAFVVTPICPHALTNRPVVVPATSRVMVRLGAPAAHVQLTVDGQWGTGLADGDRVELSGATE